MKCFVWFDSLLNDAGELGVDDHNKVKWSYRLSSDRYFSSLVISILFITSSHGFH